MIVILMYNYCIWEGPGVGSNAVITRFTLGLQQFLNAYSYFYETLQICLMIRLHMYASQALIISKHIYYSITGPKNSLCTYIEPVTMHSHMKASLRF